MEALEAKDLVLNLSDSKEMFLEINLKLERLYMKVRHNLKIIKLLMKKKRLEGWDSEYKKIFFSIS